jgi:hypothetical protein
MLADSKQGRVGFGTDQSKRNHGSIESNEALILCGNLGRLLLGQVP